MISIEGGHVFNPPVRYCWMIHVIKIHESKKYRVYAYFSNGYIDCYYLHWLSDDLYVFRSNKISGCDSLMTVRHVQDLVACNSSLRMMSSVGLELSNDELSDVINYFMWSGRSFSVIDHLKIETEDSCYNYVEVNKKYVIAVFMITEIILIRRDVCPWKISNGFHDVSFICMEE